LNFSNTIENNNSFVNTDSSTYRDVTRSLVICEVPQG